MRAQSPALAALATAQKTNRYIPLCSRPSAHGVFVQPERRLLSRASRGLRHASRERLWSTCPYSAVAGSLARRDQGAMFSMAIRTAQVDAVQDLLERGTKASIMDEPGALVLSFAAYKAQEAQEALHRATEHHAVHADHESQLFLNDAREHQQASLEIVSLLLSHGANPDEAYTPGNNLSTNGAWSPEFKYKPRRLLHQGVIWGNAAMTALLLQHDADQNARDFNGWSPLHHAASNNHVAAAEALLSGGAASSFRDSSNTTPLHMAAKADALEVCQLLISRGAEKQAQDQAGDTPLHAAAQNARPALVQMLLEEGCNPLAENLLGKVPYDLANRPGNEDAMRLLIAACIDWQLALRTPSTKGSC
ncbi:hypothetical protein ABBQ38_013329 [Trebouxia sp. C0009 RCD-2024]